MKSGKFFLSLIMFVSILMPIKAYSLDITAGVATWYAWLYQPYTQDVYHGIEGVNSSRYDETEHKPNLLYGPALSVKFSEDFNLTFIFLYGKFKITEVDKHDEVMFMGASGYYDIEYSFKRIDSDIALNYRLNDYFKIFAGIKYLSFSTDHSFDSLPTGWTKDDLRGMVYEIDRSGVGPGLGVTIILPMLIFDNLFLISNISGFYLWTEEKKGYFSSDLVPSGTGGPIDVKTKCKDYGMNLTMSLAYYIQPIATTLSVGGRGQFVRTKYDSEYKQHLHKQKNKYGDDYNTSGFYGVTLTATYTFGI